MERAYEHMKAYQFELGAQMPISWKRVSHMLKRAADKLYDYYHDATLRDIQRLREEVESNQIIDGVRDLTGAELEDVFDEQLISAYFLLIGYAFENLLKGVLMSRHPEYFKACGKMKDIRSHDLVGLCGRCNIRLQEEDASLLEELTIYIEWKGKYPIPLESEKMWPTKQTDGSWAMLGRGFDGRKTQEDVNNLYIRLLDELERQPRRRVVRLGAPPVDESQVGAVAGDEVP